MYMSSVIGGRWDLEMLSQGLACARGARKHACLHRCRTMLQWPKCYLLAWADGRKEMWPFTQLNSFRVVPLSLPACQNRWLRLPLMGCSDQDAQKAKGAARCSVNIPGTTLSAGLALSLRWGGLGCHQLAARWTYEARAAALRRRSPPEQGALVEHCAQGRSHHMCFISRGRWQRLVQAFLLGPSPSSLGMGLQHWWDFCLSFHSVLAPGNSCFPFCCLTGLLPLPKC